VPEPTRQVVNVGQAHSIGFSQPGGELLFGQGNWRRSLLREHSRAPGNRNCRGVV